jgi:hypothetical protein
MNNPFKTLGFLSGGMQVLNAKEAQQAIDKGAVMLDFRETYETDYKTFDVANYCLLPFSCFEADILLLDKKNFFIIADSVGVKNHQIHQRMVELGFQHLSVLGGGFRDWDIEKNPVHVNPEEQLTGSCTCMLRKQGKISKKK